MSHGHDGLDAVVAGLGDGASDGDRFRADRDPADIGVDVHAGHDAAVAGAQRRSHLLPVIAIALADRLCGGGDQFLVFFAQHSRRCIPVRLDGGVSTIAYFANSFSPSRMSCAVSALSPALRAAEAMAAAACGWPYPK